MQQAPEKTTAIAVNSNDPKKITFLTSIGAGLEYYDFIIYSLLANFIGEQFFPKFSHAASLLATFGVFAIGYVMRPIGGIVLGVLGDRWGRKKVFLSTMFLMALATFGMGLVPNYASLGITATIIFTFLRILQGFSFGAELPGALTFLIEHIAGKRRGLCCGFMISSVGIGVAVGSLAIYIFTKILSVAQMQQWGWRMPFLIGGLLAIVGYFMRRHLTETPQFLQLQKHAKNAMWKLFKGHPLQLARGIGLILFPACLVMFFLAMPVYLHDVFHYQFADIYLAVTFGYLWSALLLPLFGWLTDKISKKLLFLLATLVMITFGFVIFRLFHYETRITLFIFAALYQTIIAAATASSYPLLAEFFPTEIRYTGTAFCYNIAYTMAALFPLLINYIYEVVRQPQYVYWVFTFLALIAILCVIKLRGQNA